jgi:hypothetical protein
MSDQSLSRDELASALLDGEVAGPNAIDHELTVRVEELRQAAAAIAGPVPVDDAARERAIAAALAEFDAPTAEAESTGATVPPATPLSQRRRWMPALAGAAAAVVVLVGVVAVTQRDDSKSNETASVLAPSASTTIGSATAGGLATGSDSDVSSNADAAAEAAIPPNAPAPASRDLGEIADEDQLRAALRAETFANKGANVAPDACEAPVRASTQEDLGTFAGSVTLQLEEQPARALVFIDSEGVDHVVVVANPTCEVLDRID